MVSALSRKELNQNWIDQVKTYNGFIWRKANSVKTDNSVIPSNQDNFPYALREFINSQPDLPTFDELGLKMLG